MTEGSEIDLDNNTYRSVKSLFDTNFGKWKPCPQFDYVSVFKTKENQTVRVVTAQQLYRVIVFTKSILQ